MRAEAFCPGHVTGFFQICRSRDILRTGSRGAGMCLAKGARSVVKMRESQRQRIRVTIDGVESQAPVTKSAVCRLLGDQKFEVEVSTTLELPQSQGFGMSAAGSLSAALAVANIIGAGRQSAFEAAHIAEIERGCGLGDISALHKGGITVRVKPGLPPIGKVLRISGEPEVVLAVIGRRLLTKSVLRDPKKTRAINRQGSSLVDSLAREPSLERLMQLSTSFSTQTGLASRNVINAMNAASKVGMASMAMLGNSVFAIGDTEALSAVLSGFGDVFVTKVDLKGPMLV